MGAICWVANISLAALLRGENIASYWEGASVHKITTAVILGKMSANDFYFCVNKILETISAENTIPYDITTELEELRLSSYDEHRPPTILDLNEFRKDQYRSIARSLFEFRNRIKKSSTYMARVLGVSEQEYMNIEDSENPPKFINMNTAVRFKLGFSVDNTASWLSYMDKYRGCFTSRAIHQRRETLIFEILKNTDEALCKSVCDFAKTMQDANDKLNIL